MVNRLGDDLSLILKDAEELYVAVALMKDYGFKQLEQLAVAAKKKRYLAGIYLPTSPSALRLMLNAMKSKGSNDIESRVFDLKQVFHPKVYLIRKKDGNWLAWVGSANATQGGFLTNVEMSVVVSDQRTCEMLYKWFEDVFNKSSLITSRFIDNYEITYRKNRKLESTRKGNIAALLENQTAEVPLAIASVDQFFSQSDFDAFAPITHTDDSELANAERLKVRTKLFELHELIWNEFSKHGLADLFRHPKRNKWVSNHYMFRRDFLDAVWLHYGKSEEERLKFEITSFVDHVRMQVILRHTVNDGPHVGIWIFVGKPNASIPDRQYLKKNLDEPLFLQNLHTLMSSLGDEYRISIGQHQQFLYQLPTASDLQKFMMRDDFTDYYYIGRDYWPDDSDISNENIKETVLTEFEKLYPIYQMIKVSV